MTTSDKEAMSKEPGFNFHKVIIPLDREREIMLWSAILPINVVFSFVLFVFRSVNVCFGKLFPETAS